MALLLVGVWGIAILNQVLKWVDELPSIGRWVGWEQAIFWIYGCGSAVEKAIRSRIIIVEIEEGAKSSSGF